MEGDLSEPLSLYRGTLKAEHARNTSEFFEKLVGTSGVSEEANAATVREIRVEEKLVARLETRRGWWKFLRILLTLGLVASAAVVILYLLPLIFSDISSFGIPVMWCLISTGAGILLALLIFLRLNPYIRTLNSELETHRKKLAEKTQEAWTQVMPLLRLFQWDTIANLMHRTLPALKFDPYVSRGRIAELQNSFGWNGSLSGGSDHSIQDCQSGELCGNPFFFGKSVVFHMGTQTYTGTLMISWGETVHYIDSEGKTRSRRETRTELLTASVTKPKPFYDMDHFLVYGHDAAPDLKFSREPSQLSSAGHGWFARLRMKFRIAGIERKSRKLKGFTIMSNKEFDVLFHAWDRNNEVQFRLLYTPLAQQETLKILRDSKAGFGDNFTFVKQNQINILHSAHLGDFETDMSPDRFHNYELARVRTIFNEYSNACFRAFFFAFAPLLAIPAYQETASRATETEDASRDGGISFLELESLINCYGQERFKHPASITQNILKTGITGTAGTEEQELRVTAYGFEGKERIDYIPCCGGDGKWHNVPVHWTEYLPVSQNTNLVACAIGDPQNENALRKYLTRWGVGENSILKRRSILFFIPPQK